MADIFISYKREERPVAERLSIALEQLGFDVWWDFELLSGDRYRKVIREVIEQVPATIVLWSPLAIESDFVMDEAGHAKTLGRLCPVKIETVDTPFGFGQVHTDDLRTWEGELSHPGFQALVRALEARIGRKAKLGAPTHTQAAQAATAELEAFKAAQLAGNVSALQAFLRAHPRGQFAHFVRGQIETMEAHAPAGATAATAETPAPVYTPPPAPPPPISHSAFDIPNPHNTPLRPLINPMIPKKAPPWPLIVGGAAVLLLVLLFTMLPKPDKATGNLSLLNASVRQAVEMARGNARRAEDVASKAREEARRAQNTGATHGPNGPGVDVLVGDYAGDQFAGMFQNGVREGMGVMTYGDNAISRQWGRARYEGEWAHDTRNGLGVFYWRNGRRYQGPFSNAVENGAGVFTMPDGSRYEGEFANDNYNGYGVIWSPTGTPMQTGIWTNGVLTTALAK